jgi:hypothetical protein
MVNAYEHLPMGLTRISSLDGKSHYYIPTDAFERASRVPKWKKKNGRLYSEWEEDGETYWTYLPWEVMHEEIQKINGDWVVIHVNGDVHDLRRENLLVWPRSKGTFTQEIQDALEEKKKKLVPLSEVLKGTNETTKEEKDVGVLKLFKRNKAEETPITHNEEVAATVESTQEKQNMSPVKEDTQTNIIEIGKSRTFNKSFIQKETGEKLYTEIDDEILEQIISLDKSELQRIINFI